MVLRRFESSNRTVRFTLTSTQFSTQFSPLAPITNGVCFLPFSLEEIEDAWPRFVDEVVRPTYMKDRRGYEIPYTEFHTLTRVAAARQDLPGLLAPEQGVNRYVVVDTDSSWSAVFCPDGSEYRRFAYVKDFAEWYSIRSDFPLRSAHMIRLHAREVAYQSVQFSWVGHMVETYTREQKVDIDPAIVQSYDRHCLQYWPLFLEDARPYMFFRNTVSVGLPQATEQCEFWEFCTVARSVFSSDFGPTAAWDSNAEVGLPFTWSLAGLAVDEKTALLKPRVKKYGSRQDRPEYVNWMLIVDPDQTAEGRYVGDVPKVDASRVIDEHECRVDVRKLPDEALLRELENQFTLDEVDQLLQAVGIRAFDEDFYGSDGLLIQPRLDGVEPPRTDFVLSFSRYQELVQCGREFIRAR